MEYNNDLIPKIFDFSSFGSFLGNNNFISTAIAAAITDRILELTEMLYSNIIVQFINTNNNNIEDITIKLGNKDLYIGKILLAIFRFVVMLFMIYCIGKIISMNAKKHEMSS